MDKKDEIVALREKGCTIREISQKTDVPRSTVHNILKSSQEEYDTTEDPALQRLFFHLPFTYFCPSCGKEQRHAWLCPICGKFIPAECECWWAEFNLSEVKRRPYEQNGQ